MDVMTVLMGPSWISLLDRYEYTVNCSPFQYLIPHIRGRRDTLYFKDDDARLSFLMGNYITLTNLSPREVQRIIDLRISPTPGILSGPPARWSSC